MLSNMTAIAILCLLLLERFLASDMDGITQPVLHGLRSLEKSAMKLTKNIIPPGKQKSNRKLTKFYLYTPDYRTHGQKLDSSDLKALRHFDPGLETKVIIHGFLDKAVIAKWMHHMKDEFLLLDDFNIILVDWSVGNFLPYTQAAANTAQAGEEISKLLAVMIDKYGAKPYQFHLIGHSLGSHVAGYVGERIKGLNRITGLDPATYLFKELPPQEKLDPSDAHFVDVIHTDAGGIGMVEAMGHVDFYPNGGEIQPGCTASNSLKALLEFGVVEGVRNMICSHMKAPHLFTHSINDHNCQLIGYKCRSWDAFSNGTCDFCGVNGEDCAVMGYHADMKRNYSNGTKYYLLTSNNPPYCGFEYKLTLFQEDTSDNSTMKNKKWGSMDVLNIFLYGSNGNAEFKIEGKKSGYQQNHIVFSKSFLGDIFGSVIRWEKKPMSRAKGVMDVVSKITKNDNRPLFRKMNVFPLKSFTRWKIAPIVFELCPRPDFSEDRSQQGAMFSNEYC